MLDSWEVILHSQDKFASVGVIHPTAFHTEPKPRLPYGADVSISARAETVRHHNNDTSDCRPPSAGCEEHIAGGIVVEVPLDFNPLTPAAAPGSAQVNGSGSDIHAEAQIHRSGDLVTACCAPSAMAGQSADATALALRIALATIEKGASRALRESAVLQLSLVFSQLLLQ